MSIAIHGSKRSALSNDDVVTEAEIFLTNFYNKAFGLKVSFEDCEGDTTEIAAIISKAFEKISDYKDIAKWIEAAKELGKHKEEFKQAFEDCKDMMATLK